MSKLLNKLRRKGSGFDDWEEEFERGPSDTSDRNPDAADAARALAAFRMSQESADGESIRSSRPGAKDTKTALEKHLEAKSATAEDTRAALESQLAQERQKKQQQQQQQQQQAKPPPQQGGFRAPPRTSVAGPHSAKSSPGLERQGFQPRFAPPPRAAVRTASGKEIQPPPLQRPGGGGSAPEVLRGESGSGSSSPSAHAPPAYPGRTASGGKATPPAYGQVRRSSTEPSLLEKEHVPLGANSPILSMYMRGPQPSLKPRDSKDSAKDSEEPVFV